MSRGGGGCGSSVKQRPGRMSTLTGQTMFPSPDSIHPARAKVNAKAEAAAIVDHTQGMMGLRRLKNASALVSSLVL